MTTAKLDVSLGLPEAKKIALVQNIFQPESSRPEVRTGATPFWNAPGQASAFGSIPPVPQPRSVFGNTQDSEPTNQGLFGPPPAQSRPIQGLFGAFRPPAQSQASSPTIVEPNQNSLPLFGESPSNQPAPSAQHSQTFASSRTPAPPPPYYQIGKGTELAEVRHELSLY